jgi:TrkA-N domain
MLFGLLGLIGLCLGEMALTAIVLHEPLLDAFYSAVKAMATVGPNELADHGPDWLRVYAATSMALGIALVAAFTAGLVNRLMSRRLTGIVGSRTIPRSHHVVVVGLRQVGLRLAQELRGAGVDVVAVERDTEAPNVRFARHLGIPVVIGRGGDRFVLERLSISRARALAAVTSDELENISVAVAALATRPDVRVILRAGTDDVTAETRSLFRIGIALDADSIGGACLAAVALGMEVEHGFAHDDRTWLRLTDGRLVAFP